MQVPASQLGAHLQRGLKNLYALHGDEALLVQEGCDAVRAAARREGYTERVVYTVAGAHFDWSEVLASASSPSLFADKQLLEIRIPSGKPGKDGSEALQQLAQVVQGRAGVLILLSLPRLDAATQKSAWFMALESFGVTVRLEAVERKALPQWIAQRLQQQSQRVAGAQEGQRTLDFFSDCVEGNLLAAHQEIQKLALLYGPGELSFEQVRAAVLNVARYDAFKLAEAVLSGQSLRAQHMLEGLQAEDQPAVWVHWALAEDIRVLRRVRGAVDAGQPLPLALRENRVWGLREKLMERALPRLTAAVLAEWVQQAHVVDGIIKGLKHPQWPADPWVALQRLAQGVSLGCALR